MEPVAICYPVQVRYVPDPDDEGFLKALELVYPFLTTPPSHPESRREVAPYKSRDLHQG